MTDRSCRISRFLDREGVVTEAGFRGLSPRSRGYAVYMMAAREDQPNVPDESNQFPAETVAHRECDEGGWSAYLEVLDGEE